MDFDSDITAGPLILALKTPTTRQGFHRMSWPVLCLFRDDPTHAAARVWPVTLVARNQVHVQVRHRLAGSCAVVDADVVARRVKLGIERGFGGVEQLEHGLAFFGADGKERSAVAPGHDEGVAGRYGIFIAHGDRQVVGGDDAAVGERAKWAGCGHGAACSG